MFQPYQDLLDGKTSFEGHVASSIRDPIGVGGFGGSGTRAMAVVLFHAGVAMADSINRAFDALAWPPYEKLLTAEAGIEIGREEVIRHAHHVFEATMVQRRKQLRAPDARAGWKIPGTFFWLRELNEFFPELQYVHLIRNGLDMAYSSAQGSIPFWANRLGVEFRRDESREKVHSLWVSPSGNGFTYLGEKAAVAPSVMLECWTRANRIAIDTAQEVLGDRFMVVRFEDLCDDAVSEFRRIFRFLRIEVPDAKLVELADHVKTPQSVGRYREEDWRSDFEQDQLDRVAELGYTP